MKNLAQRALRLLVGPETERPWRKLLFQIGVWTLLAAVTAGDSMLTLLAHKRSFTWQPIVLSNLANWYLWALESVLILRFARRFPLDQGRWRRHVGWHALGAVGAACLMNLTGYPVDRLIAPATTPRFGLYFATHFGFNFILYWLTAVIGYAFEYQRRYRERELAAARLASSLSQAQLQVLRMQLHPHFLFNALNAVSALVHRDPDAADRMIARLGELLRASIDGDATQEVPLRQELEFLRSYLDIMQVRFQDRLLVDLEIDPRALEAQVPNLILQPLVENAIRHAVSVRADGGRVAISARVLGDQLELAVRDDGPGLGDGSPGDSGRGLGLANTRARLESLYGAMQRFVARNRPGGGFEVLLLSPLHFASGATGPKGVSG